jgi:outer membrane autotransporter protein
MLLDGDFQQGVEGNLHPCVHPTRSANIVSQGALVLNGSTILHIHPGPYISGQTFTIAEGTTYLTGEMQSVSYQEAHTGETIPAGYFTVSYLHNPHFNLDVLQDVFLVGGIRVPHHNPNEVFNYLQQASYTENSDLYNVVINILDLPEQEMGAAFDQLHPAQFGAFDLLNMNMNSLITSILSRQMQCCADLPQSACAGCKMTLWAEPYGYFTSQVRIGEQLGFDATAVGFVSGINFCLPRQVRLGVAGGYGSNSLDWEDHRGHGTLKASYLALYTDWVDGIGSLQASVLGSWDNFEGSRHIHFPTVDRHATHSKGGYNFTTHLGGGADLAAGPVYLKPFGNLDYFYLNQNGFKEHGADALNLVVHSRGSHMLRSEVGLSATHRFKMGQKGCFVPTVWVSGINECYLEKKHYTSALVDQDGSFEVRTFNKPIYLVSPGIDLNFLINPSLSLSTRYSAEVNGQVVNQKLDGRAQWAF